MMASTGPQRLAHLDGDQPGELLLFAFENLGSANHVGRTLREGGATVAGKRRRGGGQLSVKLLRCERLKDLDSLSVEGVDGGNRHGSSF
jgi:hypothetical protein